MPIVRVWAGLLLAGLLLLARAWGEDADPEKVPDKVPEFSDIVKNGKRPKLIKSVQPEYPILMSRAGLIGTVNVMFVIDKQGNVRNPYVIESNNPWFERPAIDAVAKWKFQPGEMNGQPIYVRAAQKVEFNLFGPGMVPELWSVSKGKDHKKLPEILQWYTPPAPLFTAFPVYPFEQLRNGIEGKAKVSYVVGPDGQRGHLKTERGGNA